MVQVKGVRRLDSGVSITLSNWLRMAKQPLPWFVMVVEVIDLQPRRVFLVHIGEHWIARTLRALTRMARASEEDLNHRKMRLKVKRSDELTEVNGASFRAALQRDAGEPPGTYAASKQRLVDNVGYERARYRGTLRLAYNGLDELAEFAVGLRDEMPIAQVVVDRVRFGIAVREFQAAEGILKLPRPPASGRVRLTVTRPETGTRASLEFELVKASSVFPSLPPEHEHVWLRHPVLQMRLSAGTSMLDFHFQISEADEMVRMDEVGPAAEFVTTLAEAGGPVDCVHRPMPITDSGASRSPIPVHPDR